VVGGFAVTADKTSAESRTGKVAMGAASRSVPLPTVAPDAPGLAPTTPQPPRLFVPRPRLDSFLAEVVSTPVTLLVAPAGSGKTAAAAAWTRDVRGTGAATVTWLRGDRTDDLDHQLECLREPVAGQPRRVLVIDDAHLLSEGAARALGAVLTEDPDSVRLLLISRRDLPLVPVPVVLAGQVRSLRVEDLRFTEAEAVELVRAHYPDAGPDDVAAVLDQGDGWAAALVLGSRALRGSGNIAGARASLIATRQPVLDYLLHEVVEGLPPDHVQILVTTCQQDDVSPDEAILLSGVPEAASLLAEAAAAGFMVTGYRAENDETPRWRYHPLLLDLLRRRTSPTGPDWPRAVEAHHRATEHYLDRRDAERAVRHARLSGDLDLQLRVLREFATELMSRRRTDLVAAALDDIPVDIRSRHQELLVLHASVLRSLHQIDAAKVATDRALTADVRSLGGVVHRDVDAQLAMLELWQACYGWAEAEPALARAAKALGCRHDCDREVSTHDLVGLSPLKAAWLMLELASLQTWRGELGLAAVHVQDVMLYSFQVDLPFLHRAALAHRATIEMIAGAYQASTESAEAALALGRAESSPPDLAFARAHLALGWGRLQELRIDEARACLAQFESAPREVMEPLLLVYGRLLKAGVLSACGRIEEARRELATRGHVPERLPAYAERSSRQLRLLADAAMGDLRAVEAEARRMRTVGMEADARIGEAVAFGLGGDERCAVRILDEVLGTADVPADVATVGAILRVAFLQRIGTPEAVRRARDLVPDALSRVATQRLLWLLSTGILISPGFVDLVAEQAAAPDGHPFAGEALAALRAQGRPYPDQTPHRPDGSTPPADEEVRRLLTPRELEVLEQLALGGGNSDLARALFVSENTVKTHLASIFRKLAVDRRIDALRVARARGLI
jgi:LuxR family maltose regulon positive regulatory protein